jgi:hypothetical protein
MAVVDDLNRLAAEDIVYLQYSLGGEGPPMAAYRGRLRQSLNGEWVFVASADQSGVIGFVLGPIGSEWESSESPDEGITISLTRALAFSGHNAALSEFVLLTSLIPKQFAD